MKRLVYLALSLTLVCALAACGEAKPAEKKEAGQERDQGSEELVGQDLEQDRIKLPTIQEQVLFESEEIKIVTKAGKLEADILGDIIVPLSLENRSSSAFDLMFENTAVNGMTLDIFDVLTGDCNLVPGEKKDGHISISGSALQRSEIQELGDLVTDMRIIREGKEEILVENKEIKTSMSGKVEQKLNTEGKVIYDQDGIRLIVRDALVETAAGPALVFFFENKSDHYVKFGFDSGIMLNDKEMEHHFGIGLKAGAKGVFYDAFMGQKEPIKTVDMKVRGLDAEFIGEEIIPPFDLHLEF